MGDLKSRLLTEPVAAVQSLIRKALREDCDAAAEAALEVMLELVRRPVAVHPETLRFELLLLALVSHDGDTLTGTLVQDILHSVTSSSPWLYGGVCLAVYAPDFAADPWLEDRFRQMDSTLQAITKELLLRVNPMRWEHLQRTVGQRDS
jgi:hypothetical protein